MKCWNCLHQNSAKSPRCEQCDQALRPNPKQRSASRRRIEFLLHEIENWPHLNGEQRDEVRRIYSARLDRLDMVQDIGPEVTQSFPRSDWALPETDGLEANKEEVEELPEPVPVSAAEESPALATPESTDQEGALWQDSTIESASSAASGQPLLAGLDPSYELAADDENIEVSSGGLLTINSPSLIERLAGESDIRWFHTLGALLVVAAVVGWLRSSWDSYGRQLTGILIAVSPVILNLTAVRLKRSVPLSARLLSVLGNILTPLALLSLDIFGNLPSSIPTDMWWTFSFLVSAVILLLQADRIHEKTPLYLGGLCCVMAGWSQGALTTAALSLALGFFFQWNSPLSEEDRWAVHRRQVGFYAGAFGAATSLFLFDTGRHPAVPVGTFTVALFFLSFPQLLDQREASSNTRVLLQTIFTIVGGIMMRSQLGLPPGGVALYLLFATAMLLMTRPDSPTAAASARAASVIGALSVFVGFLNGGLPAFFAYPPLYQTILRVIFGLAGSVFFFSASRRQPSQQGPLFIYSLLCVLGAWTHLFLRLSGDALSATVTSLDPQAVILRMPLVASLPLLLAAILATARALLPQERRLCWVFSAVIYLFSFSLAVACRGLTGEGEFPQYWPALLTHLPLIFLWERGWLAGSSEGGGQDMEQIALALPRAVAASFSLAWVAVCGWPLAERLEVLFVLGVLGAYLFPKVYRAPAFEVFWLSAFPLAFELPEPWQRLLVALATFPVALALKKRKSVSLTLSTTLAGLMMVSALPRLATALYFLPSLLFLAAGLMRAREEEEPADLGAAKLCWPILVILGLFVAPVPVGGAARLAYCLGMAALAGVLWSAVVGSFNDSLRARLCKVLTPQSTQAVFVALLVWSLGQSTLEFGSLLIVLGIATGLGSARSVGDPDTGESKGFHPQLSWGLTLFGLAQVFSPHFFLLEPMVVVLGALLAETLLVVARKRPAALTHVLLLTVVYVQHFAQTDDHATLALFCLACLFSAVRALQHSAYPSTIWGAALFLLAFDGLLGGQDLSWKVRLLPTCITFAAAGLWRWRTAADWPKQALQISYMLLVAPASLEFLVGRRMMENCLWLLVVGSALIVAHWRLPDDLKLLFRQAGGITLVAWVGLSFTRAALELPWQAATLLIGLAMVGFGVWVEKRRRVSGGESKATEAHHEKDS